jgi:hypothetical protein
VPWLAAPHVCLGLGLGATDAALVPALAQRRARTLPHVAALLQAASSVAYTLGTSSVRTAPALESPLFLPFDSLLCTNTPEPGPVVGGLVSWSVGFEATMRALGVLNLLYTVYLYRALRAHPLSEQVILRIPTKRSLNHPTHSIIRDLCSQGVNYVPYDHRHHQPINVPTAGAQAFLMDRRTGHNPPREPSAAWWVPNNRVFVINSSISA